jgi:tRNA A-37 threonylcarbamoyl transferase component Bud32
MTSALQAGYELAGYRIVSQLARGGFSTVYLVRDLGLHRRVAVKVLAPELAADARFRQRFLRESQVAASLDHPNIVPIYDAGEAEGLLFIAMRYVEGTDLGTLLSSEGPLELARVLALLGPIADALDTAHQQGLVHRDVKPGNVLIGHAGGREHAYLADFGLTKNVSSLTGLTATGQFLGTVDYMAPEQIEGRPVTAATDVYSLGCVLFECLSGHPPFERETEAAVLWGHMQEAPPPLGQPALDPVFAKALAKEPAQRFETCGAFVAAATPVAASPTRPADPAVRRTDAPRPSIDWRALRAGAVAPLNVVVLVVLAAIAAFLSPWLVLVALGAYGNLIVLSARHRSRAMPLHDWEWRVRSLLPISPPGIRESVVRLGSAVFRVARATRDIDGFLARTDPRALRRQLTELRETAVSERGADAADRLARQLADLERLTTLRRGFAQETAPLEAELAELRPRIFDVRAGVLTPAELLAGADALTARVETLAGELEEAYLRAIAHAPRQQGDKLRRTMRRGIFRQGSSFVVVYYDERGDLQRRAYETMRDAVAFRRSLNAERNPQFEIEPMPWHQRHAFGGGKPPKFRRRSQ